MHLLHEKLYPNFLNSILRMKRHFSLSFYHTPECTCGKTLRIQKKYHHCKKYIKEYDQQTMVKELLFKFLFWKLPNKSNSFDINSCQALHSPTLSLQEKVFLGQKRTNLSLSIQHLPLY